MLHDNVFGAVCGSSCISATEMMRQLADQQPDRYSDLSTKQVNQQLYALKAADLVKFDKSHDHAAPKWKSTALERTSFDEIKDLAAQQRTSSKAWVPHLGVQIERW